MPGCISRDEDRDIKGRGGGGHEGMMVVPDVCRGALCSNAVFLLDF